MEEISWTENLDIWFSQGPQDYREHSHRGLFYISDFPEMPSPAGSSSAPPSSASPGWRVGTSQHPHLPSLWNSLRVFQSNSSLFQMLIKKPSCRLTYYPKFQTEKSNLSDFAETNKSLSEET